MAILIRVKAKTEWNEWRTIRIDGASATCDCAGFRKGICSHIDAVLIAGERAMVHPDDIAIAAEQSQLLFDLIDVPSTWRATWRRELSWRGISRQGRTHTGYFRRSPRPLVAFSKCKNRTAMLNEAKLNGWDVTDEPSAYLDVLVTTDPTAHTAKLRKARQNAIPIITPEEWRELMIDGALPTRAASSDFKDGHTD